MTDSKSQDPDQQELKELLDLLEKLVELPSRDPVSMAGIRAAYQRKLFRNMKPRVIKPSSQSDSLWDLLLRERNLSLKNVLDRYVSEQEDG